MTFGDRLGGGQVGGRAGKSIADGVAQSLHRCDCDERDQNDEQSIFCQVLPFLFLPETLQKVLHSQIPLL